MVWTSASTPSCITHTPAQALNLYGSRDEDTYIHILMRHTFAQVQNLYGSRDEDKRGDAFITAFGDLYACDATATAARFAAGCVVEAVQRVRLLRCLIPCCQHTAAATSKQPYQR
eukprot:365161-Chlamydomonas_euryale.AAC.4